jgi:hypothetical protein
LESEALQEDDTSANRLKKLKIFKNNRGELITNAYAAGEHVHIIEDDRP